MLPISQKLNLKRLNNSVMSFKAFIRKIGVFDLSLEVFGGFRVFHCHTSISKRMPGSPHPPRTPKKKKISKCHLLKRFTLYPQTLKLCDWNTFNNVFLKIKNNMFFLLYAILSCLLHIYNKKEETFVSSAGVRLTSLNCLFSTLLFGWF